MRIEHILRFNPVSEILTKTAYRSELMNVSAFTGAYPSSFVMGEKRLYIGGDVKTAALSFKPNAPDRDLLNMFTISSMAGKEHFLLLTCDMEDAQRYIPAFTAMVEGFRLEPTDCLRLPAHEGGTTSCGVSDRSISVEGEERNAVVIS